MSVVMPWERVDGGKVTQRHIYRQAVIYVRQSSRQQVLDHQESTLPLPRTSSALVRAGSRWFAGCYPDGAPIGALARLTLFPA
jgi:hypothetical protein